MQKKILSGSEFVGSYMYYMGVPTFLACPHQPDPTQTDIALVGVPYSGGNPVERGQYLGPRTVRNTSMGYRRVNRTTKVNPFELCRIMDIGDVPLPNVLDPNKAV